MIKKLSAVLLLASVVVTANHAYASDDRFPYCASADSDSDGDGYGWENEQTCLVSAQNHSSYTVTVRNLTYQQVFSPVMAVTHTSNIALLTAGYPAGAGITAIAEGGDVSILQAELTGVDGVSDYAASGGPVPFAQETTIEVDGAAGDVISIVSMLVNTNDAIMFVGSLELPSASGDYVKSYAIAYDAGTESNHEMCADIPGPACGGAGASPDDDGEGFVHVHRGLQGVGDLDVAANDWLNPVAVITVTRN